VLLAAVEPEGSQPPPFVTSDDTIRQRTGRGWEHWLDLLDDWGAADLSHRDIARRVAQELGIGPLVWEAQAVAISYERARGLRVVGQHTDGFSVTAAKTVAVPVDRLYDAFVEESLRRQWLPDGDLRTRTATRPRSARFDWGDGRTRVHVSFDAKDDARSTASLAHSRLADAGEADRMKAYWREHMTALKARLEGGGSDA
jgi:hypothetical protein